MKGLGIKAYRFSISWPRIFPEGVGAPNPKGLDFYSRLVDDLLAHGIEPFATLFHWDLPQALQDRGGWEAPSTVKAFADYAGYVTGKLSDRVKYFFPINEIFILADFGYGSGVNAPGLKLDNPHDIGRLSQVRHHGVLAHGLAVQAIRASAREGTKVGTAENMKCYVPLIETEENVRATTMATREKNAALLTVIMEGRYRDSYLAELGANAPKFTEEELKIISSPLDFVGNQYLYSTRLCSRYFGRAWISDFRFKFIASVSADEYQLAVCRP